MITGKKHKGILVRLQFGFLLVSKKSKSRERFLAHTAIKGHCVLFLKKVFQGKALVKKLRSSK